MATLYSTLITSVRNHIKETSASFWSDAELLAIAVKGTNDLWGAIIDLEQEHFQTDDITNVSIANAGDTVLTGVPTDTFRVHLIEPRDTTQSGSFRNVIFVPRDYNAQEFVLARSMDQQDPNQATIIYYTLFGAGSPVAAPTIKIAPPLTAAVTLRFVYTPTLGSDSYTTGSTNPIPGESDNALIAWTVAYARAKEREDRSPDPNWLEVYATEKQNLLTRLTPRQVQEPDVVADYFDNRWT